MEVVFLCSHPPRFALGFICKQTDNMPKSPRFLCLGYTVMGANHKARKWFYSGGLSFPMLADLFGAVSSQQALGGADLYTASNGILYFRAVKQLSAVHVTKCLPRPVKIKRK